MIQVLSEHSDNNRRLSRSNFGPIMRPPPLNTFSLFSNRPFTQVTSDTNRDHVPYQLWGDFNSETISIFDTALKEALIASTCSNDIPAKNHPDHLSNNSYVSEENSSSSIESPRSSSDDDLGVKSSPDSYLAHRRLDLSPSRFSHGCVCGHNVEIRDVIYDLRNRRNTRCPGITIRPKTPPIAISLRA